MQIASCAMTSLGRPGDAAEARWQELCRNDGQGLRTLLGQKVSSATHNNQTDTEMTAEAVSLV